MFRYVIRGEGMMSLAVHSDMSLTELKEYVRKCSKKTHPKGKDHTFNWGIIEFMNPEVLTLEDYGDFGPALIGIQSGAPPGPEKE